MLNSFQQCQICPKQARFTCGECQYVVYCSRQHQMEHWRLHKDQCKICEGFMLREKQSEMHQERLDLRKTFFQNFEHRIFDECLMIAQQIVLLETKFIKKTKHIFNELEYGVSICLLCRSYLLLRDPATATIRISSYLTDKKHFLEDLNAIPSLENHSLNEPLKEFTEKKLSLLATVANILYEIKGQYLEIYAIYTDHVEKIYGKNSFEVSNCYFMIGTYFTEKKEYNKAIASFFKAADMRGNKAGDCYYNLGILFKLINQPDTAIKLLETAARFREKQFGEYSTEVAQAFHSMGMIEVEQNNFKLAIKDYEKVLRIYAKNKLSQKYEQTTKSIRDLEKRLQQELKSDANMKDSNPFVLKELKRTMKEAKKKPTADDDQHSEHSKLSEERRDFSGRIQYRDYRDSFKVTDKLLNCLNPLDYMRLSDLQLELQKATSQYMIATLIGKSDFLKYLTPNKKKQLEEDNKELFQIISLASKKQLTKEEE